MKVLITGRAGTGKTTVATALRELGHEAFDGDSVAGLCSWRNLTTGERVSLDATGYVDITAYGWMVDEVKLKQFLEEHPNCYLCLGANNELDIAEYFDRCYVLDIPLSVHEHRLKTRTNNSYGRDARMIQRITDWQARLITEASQRGYTIVDATKPVDAVIAEILRVTAS